MARAIVNVPASAKRGEIIEIKALVAHDMETGFRRTETGALIPRDIITRVRLHLQRRGDIPRRALPGDRRQSATSRSPRVATESGTHRVHLDRRQRLLASPSRPPITVA